MQAGEAHRMARQRHFAKNLRVRTRHFARLAFDGARKYQRMKASRFRFPSGCFEGKTIAADDDIVNVLEYADHPA